MNRTTLVLGLFLAAVAYGLVTRFTPRENFMQHDIGKPLNSGGMGPYDEQGPVSGWAGNEEAMPVATMPANQAMDSNKLMYMVGNQTDPSCCPSTFSSDTGCICLTGEQRDTMAHRGGNK